MNINKSMVFVGLLAICLRSDPAAAAEQPSTPETPLEALVRLLSDALSGSKGSAPGSSDQDSDHGSVAGGKHIERSGVHYYARVGRNGDLERFKIEGIAIDSERSRAFGNHVLIVSRDADGVQFLNHISPTLINTPYRMNEGDEDRRVVFSDNAGLALAAGRTLVVISRGMSNLENSETVRAGGGYYAVATSFPVAITHVDDNGLPSSAGWLHVAMAAGKGASFGDAYLVDFAVREKSGEPGIRIGEVLAPTQLGHASPYHLEIVPESHDLDYLLVAKTKAGRAWFFWRSLRDKDGGPAFGMSVPDMGLPAYHLRYVESGGGYAFFSYGGEQLIVVPADGDPSAAVNHWGSLPAIISAGQHRIVGDTVIIDHAQSYFAQAGFGSSMTEAMRAAAAAFVSRSPRTLSFIAAINSQRNFHDHPGPVAVSAGIDSKKAAIANPSLSPSRQPLVRNTLLYRGRLGATTPLVTEDGEPAIGLSVTEILPPEGHSSGRSAFLLFSQKSRRVVVFSGRPQVSRYTLGSEIVYFVHAVSDGGDGISTDLHGYVLYSPQRGEYWYTGSHSDYYRNSTRYPGIEISMPEETDEFDAVKAPGLIETKAGAAVNVEVLPQVGALMVSFLGTDGIENRTLLQRGGSGFAALSDVYSDFTVDAAEPLPFQMLAGHLPAKGSSGLVLIGGGDSGEFLRVIEVPGRIESIASRRVTSNSTGTLIVRSRKPGFPEDKPFETQVSLVPGEQPLVMENKTSAPPLFVGPDGSFQIYATAPFDDQPALLYRESRGRAMQALDLKLEIVPMTVVDGQTGKTIPNPEYKPQPLIDNLRSMFGEGVIQPMSEIYDNEVAGNILWAKTRPKGDTPELMFVYDLRSNTVLTILPGHQRTVVLGDSAESKFRVDIGRASGRFQTILLISDVSGRPLTSFNLGRQTVDITKPFLSFNAQTGLVEIKTEQLQSARIYDSKANKIRGLLPRWVAAEFAPMQGWVTVLNEAIFRGEYTPAFVRPEVSKMVRDRLPLGSASDSTPQPTLILTEDGAGVDEALNHYFEELMSDQAAMANGGQDFAIIRIAPNGASSGTMYRGSHREQFTQFTSAVMGLVNRGITPVILIPNLDAVTPSDNAHTEGDTIDNLRDALHALQGSAVIVATATERGLQEVPARSGFKQFFREPIFVPDMSVDDTIEIVREQAHGTLTNRQAEYLVRRTGEHRSLAFPGAALDALSSLRGAATASHTDAELRTGLDDYLRIPPRLRRDSQGRLSQFYLVERDVRRLVQGPRRGC